MHEGPSSCRQLPHRTGVRCHSTRFYVFSRSDIWIRMRCSCKPTIPSSQAYGGRPESSTSTPFTLLNQETSLTLLQDRVSGPSSSRVRIKTSCLCIFNDLLSFINYPQTPLLPLVQVNKIVHLLVNSSMETVIMALLCRTIWT